MNQVELKLTLKVNLFVENYRNILEQHLAYYIKYNKTLS